MAEAVGVVLGVVSLIVSAVENYHNTTNFFKTIKHFPRKLKEFLQVLETQELCFRKANERLLNSIVNEDQARQMLANPGHDNWHDEDIARKYSMLLGGSVRGFESAVVLVSEKLITIKGEFQKFEIPQHEVGKVVKKRLRFAFNQSKIEESLRDLREKTQDFVTLTDLTSSRTIPANEGAFASADSRKELKRFSKVKRTAEDLHLALGSACTVHTDHQAHLSLDPDYSDTNQIRFTLAFSQLSIQSSTPTPGHPSTSTWLAVESSITGTLEPVRDADENLGRLENSLKRTFDDLKSDEKKQKLKGIKKCLRFEDEQTNHPPGLAIPQSLQIPLINLCKKGNFCHQLSKFMSKSRPATQAIGSFEMARGSKHLIYIDSKYQSVRESPTQPKLKTLHQALEDIDKNDSEIGITISHKIHLAKQLVRAVLHFHTTAWLQDTWDSQQVLVSATSSASEMSSTGLEAYVAAQIHGPYNSQSTPSLESNPLVVRNRLLFSLAIMLLELAYQKPLGDLTIPLDRVGVSPRDVVYCTANRLSKKVSAIMGPRYAETVRRCLHCDFGHGFDLKQPKLEEAFYRTVVCELDKLERIL